MTPVVGVDAVLTEHRGVRLDGGEQGIEEVMAVLAGCLLLPRHDLPGLRRQLAPGEEWRDHDQVERDGIGEVYGEWAYMCVVLATYVSGHRYI